MQFEQTYGIFNSVEGAERAISALKDHGVEDSEFSVVRRSDGKGMPVVSEGGTHGITVTSAEDATAGALKGGAAGIALGILAGAVALTVPGIGPILAAGPLWAAFGATVAAGAAGAALGGTIGYLVDQGIPADHAKVYADAIHRGDILVSVRSSHVTSADARLMMDKYGATEIGNHVVGEVADGATEPPLVDLTTAERERATEEAIAPVVTPLNPTMATLTEPTGR